MLDKEIASIFQHAQVMDSRIPRPQSGQRCGFSSVFHVKIYEDLPVFHGFSMGFPWVFHGFSMGFPWVFHGFSMGFPWVFRFKIPGGVGVFFLVLGVLHAGGSWQPDRPDGSTICCPQAAKPSPHHGFWVKMNERRD